MISSPSNPAVKSIRALRHRKEREATGRFWVEGIRLVGLLAQLSSPVQTLVVAPELLISSFAQETVESLRSAGVPVLEVTAAVFETISGKDGPQGIGAVVQQQWVELAAATRFGGLCGVALDRIADPGNLGTVMRTCDAVAASGIMLIGDTTDPYDPAAVRGSMGAVLSTRLVRATEHEFVAWARNTGVNVVGTSDSGTIEYRNAAYTQPLTVLLGSERHGLSTALLETCTELVRIPMVGLSDSLNLAVATGVVLYEVFQRTRQNGAV